MSQESKTASQRGKRCLQERYGKRNLIILDWGSLIVLGVCYWIGIQQSRGSALGWVTSYGGDLFGPLFLQWSLFRVLFPCSPRGVLLATLMTLGGCFAWEFAQLFDFEGTPLVITKGTYDPYDLVSYILSVAVGLGVDRIARRARR